MTHAAPSQSPPRTMFQKIWDQHVVQHESGKQAILYIDLHLVHEVTSAQAFEGLRLGGPQGKATGADDCNPGPQHSDDRSIAADRRCDLSATGRHVAE